MLQSDITCDYRCSGDPAIICGYNGTCGAGQGTCEPEEFVLEHGAKLDLNGHTLTSAYQASAARCGATDDEVGRCTVKGPGTIVGRKGTAISSNKMDVVVRDVTIGNSDYAIQVKGSLTAKRLVTLSDRENWVHVEKGMTLRDSHLQSGAFSEGDAKIVNVHIGNAMGAGGGVASRASVRGRDVLIEVAGGILGRDVSLRRVTVTPDPTDYLAVEISATRDLRLVDSDVTAIASGTEPVLVRSTCETSEIYGTSATWGVCSND